MGEPRAMHPPQCGEGAVVATDSASANADCDNGAPLQRQAYSGLDKIRKGYFYELR
jgi:hypothetical protein